MEYQQQQKIKMISSKKKSENKEICGHLMAIHLENP